MDLFGQTANNPEGFVLGRRVRQGLMQGCNLVTVDIGQVRMQARAVAIARWLLSVPVRPTSTVLR
ncbi:hypothetical protein [Acidocella sp.]|uniref:hypothetical protein n=1 Tax=Acidocella sp. TaxID=50710 RepID=UPI0026254403|nr:hypothetical protein [Acidocella sp.]